MKLRDWWYLALFLLSLPGCINIKLIETVQPGTPWVVVRVHTETIETTQIDTSTPYPLVTRKPATATLTNTTTPTQRITPTPTRALSPTITPSPTLSASPLSIPDRPSGRIVFECEIFQDENQSQICMMNADGSDYLRLTVNDSANHRDPVFVPDGTSIIYSGWKDIHYELFQINLQELGTNRQLTFGPGNSEDPAISPDGRTVAFSRDHNGNQSIWLLDLKSLESWQLYGPPLGEGFNPVWSPDGNQILFLSLYKETPQLYIINVDGTNYKRLSFFREEFGQEFDWSPTTEIISFSIGKRWYRSIYTFNYSDDLPDDFGSSDGTIIIPSSSEDGKWVSNNIIPSFSTDGRWLAYVSYPVYMHPDMCEIFIYNLETQQKIQLTDNQYCDYDPDWGP